MCKPHWNYYTNARRKAALARKAAEGEAAEPEPVAPPKRVRAKRRDVSSIDALNI